MIRKEDPHIRPSYKDPQYMKNRSFLEFKTEMIIFWYLPSYGNNSHLKNQMCMNYSLNVVLLPQSSKIAGSVNSQLEMLGGLKTTKKTSENLRD